MEVSIKFTKEELKVLGEALFLGVVHTENVKSSKRMEELSQKIKMIYSLSN